MYSLRMFVWQQQNKSALFCELVFCANTSNLRSYFFSCPLPTVARKVKIIICSTNSCQESDYLYDNQLSGKWKWLYSSNFCKKVIIHVTNILCVNCTYTYTDLYIKFHWQQFFDWFLLQLSEELVWSRQKLNQQQFNIKKA